MKKITTLLAGIVASLSLQALADSQVTVFYPGQSQTAVVSHVENLAQLVSSPALQGKTWWPGTVIGEKLATAVALRQQQEVVARLQAWRDNLRSDNDLAEAAVVENVRQQIASLKVTGRQLVNLDPDWVRTRPQANRRLAGEYSVYTVAKPTSVRLAGAVDGAGTTPWVAGRPVADYLESRAHQSGAERNVALVISPSGEVTEVPVAYWNRRHVELAAGSTIFIGFSSWALPSDLADLNQQIVSVLTHRIPD
ncbi:capsule biosynthesis GfcC family protein [Erwinia sp. INIA-01]|uniref:capsule biosynthesis GfcC family protein n=1 Tax=Erwinia sp. INIA01 TaxID=2991500 RepID=UPI00222553A8|nr:capsule biosynthesis GfcC family protein [Erwinia sp. INIA01]MCW1873231.1 capsule biosynthesis GfcC family protein [Erwinia sp. INIA01]